MTRVVGITLAVFLVAGCGDDKKKGSAKADNKAKAKVNLTLKGEINATLSGNASGCSVSDGIVKGAVSFSVNSKELGVQPDFNLSINGQKGADKGGVAVRLLVHKPRLELVRNNIKPPPGDKAVIQDDLTITVDSRLGELGGGGVKADGKSVHIKGTVVCPPPKK